MNRRPSMLQPPTQPLPPHYPSLSPTSRVSSRPRVQHSSPVKFNPYLGRMTNSDVERKRLQLRQIADSQVKQNQAVLEPFLMPSLLPQLQPRPLLPAHFTRNPLAELPPENVQFSLEQSRQDERKLTKSRIVEVQPGESRVEGRRCPDTLLLTFSK